MGMRLLAILVTLLWGAAEATLFVIVPDVPLTFVTVRRGLRRAFPLLGWAVAGALLGGAWAYQWGAGDPVAAAVLLDRLPAISARMVETARLDLQQHGLWALFLGAFSGVPYKVFAMTAPAAGIGMAPFLLVSIPARAVRFAFAMLIVGAINAPLERRWPLRWRLGLLCGFWLLFYLVFFALMPG